MHSLNGLRNPLTPDSQQQGRQQSPASGWVPVPQWAAVRGCQQSTQSPAEHSGLWASHSSGEARPDSAPYTSAPQEKGDMAGTCWKVCLMLPRPAHSRQNGMREILISVLSSRTAGRDPLCSSLHFLFWGQWRIANCGWILSIYLNNWGLKLNCFLFCKLRHFTTLNLKVCSFDVLKLKHVL